MACIELLGYRNSNAIGQNVWCRRWNQSCSRSKDRVKNCQKAWVFSKSSWQQKMVRQKKLHCSHLSNEVARLALKISIRNSDFNNDANTDHWHHLNVEWTSRNNWLGTESENSNFKLHLDSIWNQLNSKMQIIKKTGNKTKSKIYRLISSIYYLFF